MYRRAMAALAAGMCVCIVTVVLAMPAWAVSGPPGAALEWGRKAGIGAPDPVAGHPTFVAVVAGLGFSVGLSEDGTVWCWGLNSAGQLGDGTRVEKTAPVRAGRLTGVKAVACGEGHVLALKNDGTVWAWGDNGAGQLAAGRVTSVELPAPVAGMPPVKAIAAGARHSLAVTVSGEIWAWGDNTSGQLGDGTVLDRPWPVRVSGVSGAVAVAAGRSHSLALLADGSVLAWGSNRCGQAGAAREEILAPSRVRGLPAVSALSGGAEFSLALASDGTVWAWGSNRSGQLGDGLTLDRAVPMRVPGLARMEGVAAGGEHSLAFDLEGRLWAWGSNASGQLGDRAEPCRAVPLEVPGLEGGVAAIAAGGTHSVALALCGIVCGGDVPVSAGVGEAVAFHGLSYLTPGCTSGPTYEWDFGDGAAHSSLQNPSHSYTAQGNFTWTLTVSTTGATTCRDSGTIAVSPPCTVTCEASAPSRITAGSTATFTGSASAPYCGGSPAFDWSFGDGSAHSPLQNPGHAYGAVGTYTWTLVVTAGGVSCTRTGTIVVVDPPVVTSMTKLVPFGIKVQGSNLQSGIRVLISGNEWASVQWKSTVKVKITGGKTLKAAVPKGAATTFRFLNPDGGEVTTTWSW